MGLTCQPVCLLADRQPAGHGQQQINPLAQIQRMKVALERADYLVNTICGTSLSMNCKYEKKWSAKPPHTGVFNVSCLSTWKGATAQATYRGDGSLLLQV